MLNEMWNSIAKNMYEENQKAIDDLFNTIDIIIKVAKLLDKDCDLDSYENKTYIKKKNLEKVKKIMSECYGNQELDDYTPKFDALDMVMVYAKLKQEKRQIETEMKNM